VDLQLQDRKAPISAGHKGIDIFVAKRLLGRQLECRRRPRLHQKVDF
jgi:hypothetical protein